MKSDLTAEIEKWFTSTEQEPLHTIRGAEILLRVNKNRILYNNAVRLPAKFKAKISYELNKILQNRKKIQAMKVTHAQVSDMLKKVESIQKKRQAEIKSGKRVDHDSLPEHIKALYVENDKIRLRMRECHLRLRMIDESNSSCPDSDRYPWAKEIIALDRKYRDNWHRYDTFDYSMPQPSTFDQAKSESLKAFRLITMAKAKYAKSPSEALKQRILNWLPMLISPPEKLLSDLAQLGIIDEA